MPKLSYSSETVGCGATIELDSTEICIVSIARSGVLVQSHKKGIFLGGLRGAKLYSETDIYKATKTALALAAMYPEPSLAFKNPVLSAFANAIWHCSSAAQVCIVLNEAMANAPQTQEDAEYLAGLLKAFQDAHKKPPERPPEPKRTHAERLANIDLQKRPMTQSLLLRSAAANDDNERWLNSQGRTLREEKQPTLAEAIRGAVLGDALQITEDAKEAIGLKWKPFLAGDPLPAHTDAIVVFAFFVTVHIMGQVKKEGYETTSEDRNMLPEVVNILFLMGSTEEKLKIYNASHGSFIKILRSDAPNVRQWRDNLSSLVHLYMLNDEKLKRVGFSALFGFMLRSLVSAAE